METLGIELDLIMRWTGSFMSDRQAKLVLDGKTGEASAVDTGIPQGSLAAPIMFATYLSGIFDEVEAAGPGVRGLSFVWTTSAGGQTGRMTRQWRRSRLTRRQHPSAGSEQWCSL